MQHINPNQVELTDEEMMAWEFFANRLDEGQDIPTAIENTKNANEIFRPLSDEFYTWLAS